MNPISKAGEGASDPDHQNLDRAPGITGALEFQLIRLR